MAAIDPAAPMAGATAPPRALAIDLDGTLIATDLLIESSLALVARNPLMVFALAAWALRGKAELKRRVAARIAVDAPNLPYAPRVVALAREARAAGREVVLATGSPQPWAEAVAGHLGCFDRVLATADGANLTASRKARALVARYGERGFDYAGNAGIDGAVWRVAQGAIVVDPLPGAVRAARGAPELIATIDERPPRAVSLLHALRPHQWAKNLLVFLPLLTAHRLADPAALVPGIVAFVALCLVASAVYLVNDLADLAHDRVHPGKRRRPLASGALPLQYALVAAPALLVAGLLVASVLPVGFFVLVIAYFVATLAYTFGVKRVAILDVIVLALLYTIRVLAGAAAVQVVASFWLLAFCTFLFLSLAMAKRQVELERLAAADVAAPGGRGYVAADAPIVASLGVAAGMASVLVLALYIDSAAVAALYRSPHLLWPLCVLQLYWIARLWLLAHRGELHDDPVVFALKDRASLVLAVLAAAIIFVATRA